MPDLSQTQTLVNALGWTLIHFLWQGMSIAAIFWLVCKWTQPEQALVRYWAGMVAFLAAVVVPVATLMHYLPGATEAHRLPPIAADAMVTSAAIQPSLAFVVQAAMEPAIPFVVVLWALGVGLLTCRALLGWMGARRLVSLDTQAVSAEVRAIVQALMQRLGVRQAVHVLSSVRVQVPTVVGWIKPVILLPVSVIARLPRAQLEMIIAHELGHIRRHDYLFNLLQLMVETLFFYHPAIRWMSRQLRQEREHCCDDLVVARCQQPVLYARALASLESLRSPSPVIVMAATGGDLVHRVRRIVRRELPRNYAGFAQMALLLGVALVVSLSARQGLELSRQGTDKAIAATMVDEHRRAPGFRDLSAWFGGLENFAGLGATLRAARAMHEQYLAEQSRLARAQQQAAAPSPKARPAEPDRPSSRPGDAQATLVAGGYKAPSLSTPAHDRLAERMLAANTALQELHDSDPGERARRERQSTIDELSIIPESVVSPVYPFKARRQRLEGHVRLEFSVDASGRPRDISVVDASPPDIFEESAVRALQKWVFEVDGSHSGAARVYQDFEFNMEDEGVMLSKRERRCEIAGSRICGTQRWNK
jgi:TonB family protein